MNGIEIIGKERQEQLTLHNRTIGHDQAVNSDRQLQKAAIFCMTLEPSYWPTEWHPAYASKIAAKTEQERLAVAGALIAAEIDRFLFADDYQTFLRSQNV